MSVSPVEPGKLSSWRELWAFALTAGTELTVAVVLGFFGGRWLDGKMGTDPWLELAGAVAGILLGLFLFIRRALARPSRGA